jgi:hypothetical protein
MKLLYFFGQCSIDIHRVVFLKKVLSKDDEGYPGPPNDGSDKGFEEQGRLSPMFI